MENGTRIEDVSPIKNMMIFHLAMLGTIFIQPYMVGFTISVELSASTLKPFSLHV